MTGQPYPQSYKGDGEYRDARWHGRGAYNALAAFYEGRDAGCPVELNQPETPRERHRRKLRAKHAQRARNR